MSHSKSRLFTVSVLATVCLLVIFQSAASAADMPAAPKVSTFAPADDLVNQAEYYMKEIGKSTADQEAYKDSAEKLVRDSNTLIVIALALGLHDQENKYKASAGSIMKAADAVAAAKDFDSAQKAAAALEAAASAKSDAALKWEKVASLPELMKQVPMINTKLKMNVKGAKFKKKAKDTAGQTATLAVIAQGTMADTSAATKPEQIKQWYELSAVSRDAAAAVNVAIHKGDEEAAAKAMEKLNVSCEACHVVFKPDVK